MDAVPTRGCLQPSEIEQVSRAAPGQLPPELAGHLASCALCRERLLALDLPERAKRKPGPPITPGQRLLRVLLVVGAIAVALLTALWLAR